MGTIALDGLASGLDTTSIINSLLAASGAHLQTLKDEQADYELKKSHWQTFNTHLSDLQNQIDDISDSDDFKAMQVTSEDSTKADATITGTALAGTYSVSISQLASAQTTKTITTWAAGDTAFTTGTPEIYIAVNGGSPTTISIGTNTLDGAISAINDAGLSVYAYKVYDASASAYRLMLTGTSTGSNYDFTITQPADTSVSFDPTNVSEALNTQATVNSVSVESQSLDITDAVPGVTITAYNTTSSAIDIVVSVDKDGIKSNIQDFVDKYNTAMSYIDYELDVNDASGEAGPLAGDATLKQIQRTLQGLIRSDYTSNTINNLSLMGILTNSDGTLTVDDTDLSEALDDHFSDVISFFTSSSGIFQAFTNESENGSLDLILDTADGTIKNRTDTIDDQIENLQEQIDNEEDRLDKLEETLRARFASLEVTLGLLKSTEQYVQNVLGGMSTSSSS